MDLVIKRVGVTLLVVALLNGCGASSRNEKYAEGGSIGGAFGVGVAAATSSDPVTGLVVGIIAGLLIADKVADQQDQYVRRQTNTRDAIAKFRGLNQQLAKSNHQLGSYLAGLKSELNTAAAEYRRVLSRRSSILVSIREARSSLVEVRRNAVELVSTIRREKRKITARASPEMRTMYGQAENLETLAQERISVAMRGISMIDDFTRAMVG